MKHVTHNILKVKSNRQNKFLLCDTCYALREAKGFTLVEVLVALFIFATVSVMAVGLYTSAVNLDRQGTVQRSLQQNAGFLMDFLAKEIRNGSLDYAGYASEGINLSVQPLSKLKILYRGTVDFEEEIYLQDGQIFIKRERAGQPDTFDTSTLTDANVRVEALGFYIRPASACTENSCGGQQRVTAAVKMRANSADTGAPQDAVVDLQSTFSVRLYDL